MCLVKSSCVRNVLSLLLLRSSPLYIKGYISEVFVGTKIVAFVLGNSDFLCGEGDDFLSRLSRSETLWGFNP